MSIEEVDRTASGSATTRPRDTRRLGWVTIASGAVGVAGAVWVLSTPPQVPPERFSYPFDDGGYVVAQLTFAVQHVLMLAGVLGLATLGPRPSSRVWRPAVVAALVGFVLLVGCEIYALRATAASNDSDIAGTVGAAYGLPTILLGVAFLLLGWVIGRRRLLPWGRWVPFVFGLWVFVVLVPSLGWQVPGRLAIGGWMALYLLIGVALLRRRPV